MCDIPFIVGDIPCMVKDTIAMIDDLPTLIIRLNERWQNKLDMIGSFVTVKPLLWLSLINHFVMFFIASPFSSYWNNIPTLLMIACCLSYFCYFCYNTFDPTQTCVIYSIRIYRKLFLTYAWHESFIICRKTKPKAWLSMWLNDGQYYMI